jgi:valyl-tRNA synthetase
MNVPLEKVDVIIKTNNDEVIEIIKENEEYIHKLAKVENISIQKEIIRPKDSAFIPTRNTEIYVLLEGKVDIEKERKRLEKELQEIEKLIAEIDAKLSSHAFLEKAPAHIIANEKEKKDKFIQKKEKILENIQRISF